MFEHEDFNKYDFENIPLDRDVYLVDEKYMAEYEAMMLKIFEENGGEYKAVGYVSYACARKVSPGGVEISWYPNIYDRFHEVAAWLPRDAVVACIGCWNFDEKPRIFVKGDWLEQLHVRSYTVFAMVDAIGVKNAISNNQLSREGLVRLRTRIDELASRHASVSFISFADSLLLKSNWTVGHHGSDIKYTYRPELFFELFAELRTIYREELHLEIYAVFTQGSNEYYDDAVTHVSESGNHISLNSLGLPFAQLQSIESAARAAIRANAHPPCDLYMDELFFRSVRFKFGFQKAEQPRRAYVSPMRDRESFYFYADASFVMDNLELEPIIIMGS